MSSNATGSINLNDLSLLSAIEPYYSGFIYLLFVFKTFFFVIIFFLLSRVNAKVLQGYRFYLSINVITTYLFGSAFVLWQPVLLMPDTIFCSVGLTKVLGSYVSYILLVLALSAFSYHIVGILLCLLYQFAHVELSRLTKIFAYDQIKQSIYMGLIIFVFVVILIAVGLFLTIFEAVNPDDVSTPELRLYLGQKYNCFYLHIWSNTVMFAFVLAIFGIEFIFLICFGYLHFKMITIVFFKGKDYSDKTHHMQKMLYISLFGQTLSFCAVYLLPLFVFAVVLFINFQSVSSLIVLGLAIMNCYELSNYLFIVFTISYFRRFVKKLFFCKKITKISFEMTVHVVKPFAAMKNFNK